MMEMLRVRTIKINGRVNSVNLEAKLQGRGFV